MTPADVVLTRQGLRFMGRVLPARIGRGGVSARKREGDGATPAGVHRIIGCLYRPDRLGRAQVPGWAVPIRPFDLWCDDPDHRDYNMPVAAPFAASAERMMRADPQYDLVLATDWNWPEAQPARGSAIFIHVWRSPGHPTAGCIALRRDHLLWLARGLRTTSRLIVPERSA